jgi:hypothetical protein
MDCILLRITNEFTIAQIKGNVEYHTTGDFNTLYYCPLFIYYHYYQWLVEALRYSPDGREFDSR